MTVWRQWNVEMKYGVFFNGQVGHLISTQQNSISVTEDWMQILWSDV